MIEQWGEHWGSEGALFGRPHEPGSEQILDAPGARLPEGTCPQPSDASPTVGPRAAENPRQRNLETQGNSGGRPTQGGLGDNNAVKFKLEARHFGPP